MISLGLDSGSSMTKAVLLEDTKIIDTKMIPTSISPRKSLEALYREIKKQHKEIDVIVTTGYGRNLLDQADFKITEITCHAAGAFFMNPDCDTIIDIGGQDSKVITIDNLGCVTDFLMNDKCAAGTGRFLEMTMKRVESEIERIDTFVKDAKPAKINSMDELTYKTAFLIGLFQLIAAIFPGTSRSGATIVGALILGVSRTVAAEFTFVLAIPVMFGASLLKLVKFGLNFTGTEAIILLIGMVTAFVSSIIVIQFLMGYIKKHDFKVFGYYRIVLGILVILYALFLA